MNRNSAFTRVQLLTLGLLAIPAFAADDVCVDQAYVNLPIYGDTSMTPTWWDEDFWGIDQELIWAAATEIPNGRVVWDQADHTLFFELTVVDDNSRDFAGDKVAIGLTDMAGDPLLYVELAPMETCALVDCTAPGQAIMTSGVSYSEASDTGDGYVWSALSSVNPIADIAVVQPRVEINPAGAGLEDWTVWFGLQLPVDPVTQQLSVAQRIYMNLIHTQAGPITDSVFEDLVLCESTSTTSNDCLAFYPQLGLDLPAHLHIFSVEAMWPRIVTGGIDFCP